jgi:hypothetical protein
MFLMLLAPANLKYTKSHEWIKVDNGIGTVGITDYAQKALGDVVFVDLPAKGKKVTAGGNQRFFSSRTSFIRFIQNDNSKKKKRQIIVMAYRFSLCC